MCTCHWYPVDFIKTFFLVYTYKYYVLFFMNNNLDDKKYYYFDLNMIPFINL